MALEMTKKQWKECHAIIHSASTAAAATSGFTAMIPFVDNAVIVPTQIAMIVGLAKVFGYELSEGIEAGFRKSLLAKQVGQMASKALVGRIPIAGNIVNAGISASFTETLGWTIAKRFAEGQREGISAENIHHSVFSTLAPARIITSVVPPSVFSNDDVPNGSPTTLIESPS